MITGMSHQCPASRSLLMSMYFPIIKKKKKTAPVAHACNHSYSGDRDQEDQGLRPDWAKRK
jgi:hypothetical protein